MLYLQMGMVSVLGVVYRLNENSVAFSQGSVNVGNLLLWPCGEAWIDGSLYAGTQQFIFLFDFSVHLRATSVTPLATLEYNHDPELL